MEAVIRTKDQILEECEIEILLKNYLKIMIGTVGEDYTLATFLEMGDNIVGSLSFYSNRFSNVTNQQLMAALLKGAILSKKSSANLDRIKKLLISYNSNKIILTTFSNRKSRIEIIKIYMSQHEMSNDKLFEKLKKSKNRSGILSAMVYLNNLMNSYQKEKVSQNNQVQQKRK